MSVQSKGLQGLPGLKAFRDLSVLWAFKVIKAFLGQRGVLDLKEFLAVKASKGLKAL
jgi:hypothetical protein